MIDHFTRTEILSFYYIILGAGIKNTNKLENILKPTWAYPDNSLIEQYFQTRDKERFINDYVSDLKEVSCAIHMYIVKPIIQRRNLILITKKNEDIIAEGFVKYLKDYHKIDCINLNDLFSKGSVGKINYDFDEINKESEEFFYAEEKKWKKDQSKSEAGRANLFLKMTDKEKNKKLKELGYNPSRVNKNEIDQIIHDEWIIEQ